jgi:hypothetical protein
LRRIRLRLFLGNWGHYLCGHPAGQRKTGINFLTYFFTHLTKVKGEEVGLIGPKHLIRTGRRVIRTQDCRKSIRPPDGAIVNALAA